MLEAECYLHPHEQQNLTTSALIIAPLLPQSSVDELRNTEQSVATEQLHDSSSTYHIRSYVIDYEKAR